MTERNHKVLVADDDESVRESLSKLLQGEGYEVVAVANGAQAVETFRREQDQLGLLLVDLNMPIKNGWATVDRLLEINPTLPILIVTGQPNQYELAKSAGVSALVEKPIDVPAMLQLIQDLLAWPVGSILEGVGHRHLPFRHLRGAGLGSRYSNAEQNVSPYLHGGLNE
jgi:two-component system, cell cycle sensor histidine kinase and response regulator CckA